MQASKEAVGEGNHLTNTKHHPRHAFFYLFLPSIGHLMHQEALDRIVLTPLTGVVGSQKIPRARSKIEPDQFYFSKVTTKHGGEIKMWHTTL
jgi:hypothetical protein